MHIESPVKIYVTRDYGLFGLLQGNRSLNKNKIKKIKDEIAAGTNLLKYCPIIVMEAEGKLKVIDGQHRLEVAKQIQSYVWYVISNELSLYEIAKMNSNTEKWKGSDFINCYAVGGNHNYTKLKEFINVYDCPLNVALQLLSKGTKIDNAGSKDMELFRQGKYQVKKEQEAISVMQQIQVFSSFKGHMTGAFIIAICRIIMADKIALDDVLKAYNANPDKLSLNKNWKEYLLNLETIVNIGKSKRRVIY